MTKADVQEALVALYLRLNGYFTSGFVVQSATPHQVTAEVDMIAVRHPHSSELASVLKPSPELDLWDGGVDLIIGEVKSHGQALQFNPSIRSAGHVSTLLQWWGYLDKREVAAVADAVLAILQPLPGAKTAPCVPCARNSRVRAILFAPETQTRRQEQAWFIPGPAIFEHVWQRLHPLEARDLCATDYGAGQWGVGFAPIVRYFKAPDRQTPGDLDSLLTYLNADAG